MALPGRKNYIPAECVIFNPIHRLIRVRLCLLQTRQSSASMWVSEIPDPSVMWGRRHLGTPQPKRIVSACAWCDWEITTLGIDMRPGAFLHIDLWRNGNCNNITCNYIHAYVSINHHWRSIGSQPIKSMMLSCSSIDQQIVGSDHVETHAPITVAYERKMTKLKLWSEIGYHEIVGRFVSVA
jgi:hypothetical protein